MDWRRLRQWSIPFLGGVGCGVILCWNVEILTFGRGPISTYVAPLGLGAIFLSAVLRMRTRSDV
jgi:hypothetical protein